MNMDEQYELAEIFSYNQINQKRAKVCSVCGRTIACCRWIGTVSGSSWKYCLDCQDDHFEDWRLEWNNYIIAKCVSLSLEERHGMSERCSKIAFEVPLFPFPPRDTQDEEDNMSEDTQMDRIDVDSSFSLIMIQSYYPTKMVTRMNVRTTICVHMMECKMVSFFCTLFSYAYDRQHSHLT